MSESESQTLATTWHDSGRDPVTGRLLPGHRISVGNKGGRETMRLREKITEADIDLCLQTGRNCMGDPKASWRDKLHAAEIFLEAKYGKAAAADFVDKVDAIELTMETVLQWMSEHVGQLT